MEIVINAIDLVDSDFNMCNYDGCGCDGNDCSDYGGCEDCWMD